MLLLRCAVAFLARGAREGGEGIPCEGRSGVGCLGREEVSGRTAHTSRAQSYAASEVDPTNFAGLRRFVSSCERYSSGFDASPRDPGAREVHGEVRKEGSALPIVSTASGAAVCSSR